MVVAWIFAHIPLMIKDHARNGPYINYPMSNFVEGLVWFLSLLMIYFQIIEGLEFNGLLHTITMIPRKSVKLFLRRHLYQMIQKSEKYWKTWISQNVGNESRFLSINHNLLQYNYIIHHQMKFMSQNRRIFPRQYKKNSSE